MDEINAIANKHNLKVIIDGAQCFGASYKNTCAAKHCDIYTTSFFPSKPLGCYGDGGAVFTDNNEYAKKIKMLRVHGQEARYKHKYLGITGRLDTIQAAVLLAKLQHYSSEIKARNDVAQKYYKHLNGIVELPIIRNNRVSVWAQYTIQVKNRDSLVRGLNKLGIPSAIHYPVPLHLQECFSYLGLGEGEFPIAEKVASRVISLPMNPFISDGEIEFITDAIKRVIINERD